MQWTVWEMARMIDLGLIPQVMREKEIPSDLASRR